MPTGSWLHLRIRCAVEGFPEEVKPRRNISLKVRLQRTQQDGMPIVLRVHRPKELSTDRVRHDIQDIRAIKDAPDDLVNTPGRLILVQTAKAFDGGPRRYDRLE
jgi:hypothetical protein